MNALEAGFTHLPADLAMPVDDGAADHLLGMAMPPISLQSTVGGAVGLHHLGDGLTILYGYPMTGVPGVALPEGWDDIPGARGCTPQACAFRDLYDELRDAGAAVHGLSTQSTAYRPPASALPAPQRFGVQLEQSAESTHDGSSWGSPLEAHYTLRSRWTHRARHLSCVPL